MPFPDVQVTVKAELLEPCYRLPIVPVYSLHDFVAVMDSSTVV
jgi:hypothetical protein